MDDVPQYILETGKWVVNNQWVVDEKIASGGFGAVYRAHDVNDNEVIAVKTEKRKNKQNYVDKEVQMYDIIGNERGFPRMRWTGETLPPTHEVHQPCMAMVIDLLGPSLSDLFSKNQKNFSLKTVLMLANQMLDRLEKLHEKGIVHRDVKPGNFVMGRGNNVSCVYLIDFGLAHKFRNSYGLHINYEENVPFRGTHRYASINAHMKVEQTRRDDLESLGYVLIYFLRGVLPWQNLNVDRNHRRQVIGDIKKNTSVSEITAGLPAEFAIYLENVRALQFHEKPDYNLLRGLFRKCYVDQNFSDDGIYDWSQKIQYLENNDLNRFSTVGGKDFVALTTASLTTVTLTQTKKRRQPRDPNTMGETKKKRKKWPSANDNPPTPFQMTLRPRRRSTALPTADVIEISDNSKSE